jgi:hypothetical protein
MTWYQGTCLRAGAEMMWNTSMRRLSTNVLALLLFVSVTGCDSKDVRSDAELLVGTWTVVKAEDSEGEKTAPLKQAGDMSITLKQDASFDLLFKPADGSEETRLSNTYTVAEADGTITLMATNPFGDEPLPLEIRYAFRNDNEVVLTIPATTVALVAAVMEPLAVLKGQVRLTLQRA